MRRISSIFIFLALMFFSIASQAQSKPSEEMNFYFTSDDRVDDSTVATFTDPVTDSQEEPVRNLTTTHKRERSEYENKYDIESRCRIVYKSFPPRLSEQTSSVSLSEQGDWFDVKSFKSPTFSVSILPVLSLFSGLMVYDDRSYGLFRAAREEVVKKHPDELIVSSFECEKKQ